MIGQAQRILELTRLKKTLPAASTKIPFVAFTSGKGGTGKSISALNTALALSSLGKKVLLIDLDLNFSNLHILQNIVPRFTIGDFFSSKNTIEEVLIKINSKLDCIFGDSGKDDYSILTERNYRDLFESINSVSEKYDYVLLDNSPGTNSIFELLVSLCSYFVSVVNPEPTSVMDSYVIVKTLKRLHYSGKTFILINKALSIKNGSEAFDNLSKASEHFLKVDLELLGIINFNSAIMKSVNNQTPVFLTNENEVREQFLEIADKFVKIAQLVNNNQ